MRLMPRGTVAYIIAFASLFLVTADPRAVPAGQRTPPRAVHALFDLEAPTTAPFPSDWFTVTDPSQNTWRRVNMPLPDCSVLVSDCEDLNVINTLDGFNLQPRLSIPFDHAIDVNTITSHTVFLVRLGTALRREGDTDDDDDDDNDHHNRDDDALGVTGINQVVWDGATNTLHVESDDLLEQHTRYALIVTSGIRDAAGEPVEATETFRRFRHSIRGKYKHALLDALHAARRLGTPEREIVTASVFTTQSVTAVLEKIRDQIKAATPAPANFVLELNGERTVFPLDDVTQIAWNQHTGDDPATFTNVPNGMDLSLLRIIPGAVGYVAFGKYVSPDYEVHPGEFIPPAATRTGHPIVQGANEIYFNLFLPPGSTPRGGWPVALHGTGSNGSKQRDLYVVASLAQRGIATIIINSVGRGFGPRSTLTVHTNGQPLTFSAGGRGIDQNGDRVIGNQEGQNASRPMAIISNRDAQRQTVVDYMQLVRAIEVGMDVDGDGIPDLDPSRISYFGWSFGANYGTTFLAVEPSVREGALYSLGGPVFENVRLSPMSRSAGLGISLSSQRPSLINSPGVTKLDGVGISGSSYFNENMPLRDLRDGFGLNVDLSNGTAYTIRSPVINAVAGASAIQEYLEKRDWVNQSGNQVAYARHLRRQPLAGVPAKSVLILFGKGDQMIANPNATAMLRAGDLADRATFYRNDAAYAENSAVPKDPHPFVNNIAHNNDPLVAAIAAGAQNQIAEFLASGGIVIVHPEPARFFEVPIGLPLPEELNFIP